MHHLGIMVIICLGEPFGERSAAPTPKPGAG